MLGGSASHLGKTSEVLLGFAALSKVRLQPLLSAAKTRLTPKALARPPAKGTTTLQAEPGFFAVPSYRDPSPPNTGTTNPSSTSQQQQIRFCLYHRQLWFSFSSFSDARQATMSSFEQVVSNHRRHLYIDRPLGDSGTARALRERREAWARERVGDDVGLGILLELLASRACPRTPTNRGWNR